MKTRKQEFCGVTYKVPLDFEFLDVGVRRYPSFCGAGEGIGDKVVPEVIGGMRCSHICHIHDESWEAASPTGADFIQANTMFDYNLSAYLSSGSGGLIKRVWRVVKGYAYVIAVSTIGWKIFKKAKGMK